MSSASNPAESPASRRSRGVGGALADWISDLGDVIVGWVSQLGEITLFIASVMRWTFFRLPKRETILPNFYQIGVLSLPVIAMTGTFIGMVLAVQSYTSLRSMHIESRLGGVINLTLVRELG